MYKSKKKNRIDLKHEINIEGKTNVQAFLKEIDSNQASY